MPNTQSPATLAPLTEEQKASAACPPHFSTGQQYTRAEASAIEAAHRQQPDPLPEGMPEPAFVYRHEDACGDEVGPPDNYYTADQLRAQHAAGRRQGLSEGFEAGWRTAANWMERPDLHADVGSPAYIADRDAAIAKATTSSGQQEAS